MATTARFLKAADNSRPFKSHRYDIFGLKIDRSLTLFGSAPLNAWILLEADPTVISYCERPLIVPDTKPKRLVDFWVRFRDREELWILLRHSQPDTNTEPHDAMPAFATWAASNKIAVRFVKPIDPVERKTYLDNWGRIIRELSANRRFVSTAMVERVRECFATPRPIAVLTGLFPDEDPALLHTAAFSLVHAGRLRYADIDALPFGPASLLEAL
jgi:hypothetical protein